MAIIITLIVLLWIIILSPFTIIPLTIILKRRNIKRYSAESAGEGDLIINEAVNMLNEAGFLSSTKKGTTSYYTSSWGTEDWVKVYATQEGKAEALATSIRKIDSKSALFVPYFSLRILYLFYKGSSRVAFGKEREVIYTNDTGTVFLHGKGAGVGTIQQITQCVPGLTNVMDRITYSANEQRKNV